MPPTDDDELIGPISTARLELVPFSVRAMRATLEADLGAAADELDAEVPADLRERLGDLFAMRVDQLSADPASRPWLARAMLMNDPHTGRHRMVGSVGFHGPPAGTPLSVEIGYHVEPDVRRRGLATEAVRAMLDWAAGQGIHRFRASVAPTNAASLATIARFGFRQVGVQWDEIDGEELVFETNWPPQA
jgi:RimJ/RimL family protein N-acetyltransferase